MGNVKSAYKTAKNVKAKRIVLNAARDFILMIKAKYVHHLWDLA